MRGHVGARNSRFIPCDRVIDTESSGYQWIRGGLRGRKRKVSSIETDTRDSYESITMARSHGFDSTPLENRRISSSLASSCGEGETHLPNFIPQLTSLLRYQSRELERISTRRANFSDEGGSAIGVISDSKAAYRTRKSREESRSGMLIGIARTRKRPDAWQGKREREETGCAK